VPRLQSHPHTNASACGTRRGEQAVRNTVQVRLISTEFYLLRITPRGFFELRLWLVPPLHWTLLGALVYHKIKKKFQPPQMLGVWWIFGFDSLQYFEWIDESDNKKLNKLAVSC